MPKSSLSFEQGDIAVADILYSQQAGLKRRPVLVASGSDFNRQSDDIIVLSISSTPPRSKFDVKLSADDLAEGELRVESKILADFPTTIEKALIAQKIGKISKQKLAEVKQKTRQLYEL